MSPLNSKGVKPDKNGGLQANPRNLPIAIGDYRAFVYDEFTEGYREFTDDPEEIGRIWEFDRSLSLLLLDYILLNEQLFKACLVRSIAKAMPSFNDEFMRLGITRAIHKYPELNGVDSGIFMKARLIAEQKDVQRVSFNSLVNYLSLNALKGMVRQIAPPLFLAFLHELNVNQKEPLTPQEALATLDVMHHVRNIAAHNGQLIHRPTLAFLRSLSTDGSLRGVVEMVAKPLCRAGCNDQLIYEYDQTLAHFAPLNEKHGLWS